MGTAIADILPLALGVALSPLPIVAVILMLFSKKARSTSLGFLIGWILGVVIVSTAVVFLADPAKQATGGGISPLRTCAPDPRTAAAGCGIPQLEEAPETREDVPMPKWMSSIDSMTAGKALGLGALLSGVNPKNLALIIGAGVAIVAAGLSSSETVVVLIVFIVIASAMWLLP